MTKVFHLVQDCKGKGVNCWRDVLMLHELCCLSFCMPVPISSFLLFLCHPKYAAVELIIVGI